MDKHLKVIGLFCMVVFVAACTSCHNDPVETRLIASPTTIASSELISIDSLMWQQPDSALTCLLPSFDTCCRDGVHTVSTAYNCHYAHLLLAELLYKNDNPRFNRPDLLQAVAYFDSLICTLNDNPYKGNRHCGLDPQSPHHNDLLAFLDARTHYINGVGYYENDSAVEACKEYLKALEIMEDHFEEKELVGKKVLFVALVNTRLTDLFSDHYLHEQAIYYARLSLKYYQKQDVPSWYFGWFLCEIGNHYNMMEQLDSADYYYQKAHEFITDTTDLAYRDLVVSQAYLSYKRKVEPELVLGKAYRLFTLSESEKERLSRCLTIGELYYLEKQYDSAQVYLGSVFHNSQSMAAKKQAAEWLVEICEAENRIDESNEYARFLVPFSTISENQSHIKSQLAKLHHNFVQERQDVLHQKRIKKNHDTVNLVIGLLFGIIAIVAILYLVNKKRHQNLRVQHEEMGKLLETERYTHKMQQAALSGRLRESNNSLRLQSEKMTQLQKTMSEEGQHAHYQGDYELFVQEEPCKEIIKSLEGTNIKRISVPEDYPELSLSSQQLLSLALATEKHFQGFEDYLRRLYPKISTIDLDICRLFLLGVNEKQASILLHRDYSTIMEHVRKMKKAFMTENSLRDFIKNGK